MYVKVLFKHVMCMYACITTHMYACTCRTDHDASKRVRVLLGIIEDLDRLLGTQDKCLLGEKKSRHVLFCSVLFCSVPFCSVPLCYAI